MSTDEHRIVTGSMIRTAATGKRFELDHEIRRYNDAGKRVDLETGKRPYPQAEEQS